MVCERRFAQMVKHTYWNGNYRAHIDHVLCDSLTLDSIKDCRIVVSDRNCGDHAPLSVSLEMNVACKEVSKKFHRFKWGCEEFVARYVEELDREMRCVFLRRYCVRPTQVMLEECLSLIHDCMLRSARSAEKLCDKGGRGRRLKRLYDESPVLQELFWETKYWHQMWKDDGCEEAYVKWKECKRMCREEEKNRLSLARSLGVIDWITFYGMIEMLFGSMLGDKGWELEVST